MPALVHHGCARKISGTAPTPRSRRPATTGRTGGISLQPTPDEADELKVVVEA